eukprot:3489088-Rhodomonas_salina.1
MFLPRRRRFLRPRRCRVCVRTGVMAGKRVAGDRIIIIILIMVAFASPQSSKPNHTLNSYLVREAVGSEHSV